MYQIWRKCPSPDLSSGYPGPVNIWPKVVQEYKFFSKKQVYFLFSPEEVIFPFHVREVLIGFLFSEKSSCFFPPPYVSIKLIPFWPQIVRVTAQSFVLSCFLQIAWLYSFALWVNNCFLYCKVFSVFILWGLLCVDRRRGFQKSSEVLR